MITKAVLFDDELEIFEIEVTEENKEKIKKKLYKVQDQIINKLKEYKEQGLIKSIYLPRDIRLVKTRFIDGKDKSFVSAHRKTDLQKELDQLVKAKKEIKKSIARIHTLFN